MSEENEFVRITNREVYERLGKVEAKLDDALRTVTSQNATLIDQGKRVRALELRFYGVLAGLVGGFMALGVALSKGALGAAVMWGIR
jgi:hypothetical protein